MKRKFIRILCAAGLLTGCSGEDSAKQQAAEKNEKDSVIVTMPVTSEPESRFDPVYGC